MANLTTRNNNWMSMGDNFFDNFFPSNFRANEFKVDIKETETAYEVKADLPGFDKENLNVVYDDNILTIDAKRDNTVEDKDEDGNFLRRERSSQSFRRQFMLKGIDEDKITANFKDGVLHLELAKAATNDKDRKRIEIN
ncbi:Hsp20/alpha crystallin family protein [Enterococcus sp. HY326]|uniref:Hsp20/alpha crystallin family protein n=1 Tax=Enterococcus sp. HY326 TaxID=2971265 RepID=UPI00223EA005|nr:Hsp20/alpha crystallin family protein [Enterococcus sp. HY326]